MKKRTLQIGPLSIGFGKEPEDHELPPYGGRSKTKEAGQRQPTSKLDAQRLDPILAENMFYNEPIMQSGITEWQMMIQDADFWVTVKDNSTQKLIDNLFEGTTLKAEILEKLPYHFGIWGRFWLEHLFGKKKMITEFLAIDGKEMAGFKKIREGSQIVETDKFGRPKAYEMKKAYTTEKIPFVPDIEMSYRAYIEVTHTQLGLGMIESAYLDSTLKENIEQARTQAAYNIAWPKPVIGYGSEWSPPDARLEKKAIQLGQELTDPEVEFVVFSKSEMSVDYPSIRDLTDELVNQLMYQTSLQAAILGIPVAILMRTGKDEGRYSLEELTDAFELRFRAFQKKMKVEEIVKNVIDWNNSKMPKKDQIDLNWTGLHAEYGVLSDRAAKEFVMRVMRMKKTGLIDANDPEIKKKVDQALNIRRVED